MAVRNTRKVWRRQALKQAEKQGSGVVSLNGKMIDKPVVLRAWRVLDLARAQGIALDEEVLDD
jgi:citrate lyase subunit beta/citryl-CoA lyase